jgi:methylmalonyl-CoA mutase N-terminal domain/subunit
MATPPRELTEKERWRAERYAGTPERDSLFTTISGEPIEPLYTEEDLPADTAGEIGLPGEFPYTRGVYPSMYPRAVVDRAPIRGLRHRRGDQRDGFTYVERAIDRGLEIDAFAPRLSFFFNSHRRSRCRPRRPCGSRCAPSR